MMQTLIIWLALFGSFALLYGALYLKFYGIKTVFWMSVAVASFGTGGLYLLQIFFPL